MIKFNILERRQEKAHKIQEKFRAGWTIIYQKKLIDAIIANLANISSILESFFILLQDNLLEEFQRVNYFLNSSMFLLTSAPVSIKEATSGHLHLQYNLKEEIRIRDASIICEKKLKLLSRESTISNTYSVSRAMEIMNNLDHCEVRYKNILMLRPPHAIS